MRYPFAKMESLGNDFVFFDAVSQTIALTPQQMRFIADRRRGIGCDQILIAAPSRSSEADFTYLIYNADGSESGMCGNGARCFMRFVHACGLTTKTSLRLDTRSGSIECHQMSEEMITVVMGEPIWQPSLIPFRASALAEFYLVEIAGERLELGVVSMGNPHAVMRVPSVEEAPVSRLGPLIETDTAFPERTNVGFMEVVDPHTIRLRVFERGAGETPACGSGACAAVVVGRKRGWLADRVRVILPGGELSVYWPGGESSVDLTGTAHMVFEGWIEL